MSVSATVLELDLTAPPAEAPPTDPIGALLNRRRPLLRDVVEGLRLAADDPEVVGLVAHVGGTAIPLAMAQEIGEAVRALAAAGKATVAWTETFGELGPATATYLLASSFGEIWLQPSGDVGITGIVAEATFVKDALARLGVVPQLSARREYKSAVDTFLSDRMSDAHREASGRLVASGMEQVVAAVAQARGLSVERVRELVDAAPIDAERAERDGLVDRLGYRDQVYASLRRMFPGSRLRYLQRYRRTRRLEPRLALARAGLARRPVVALVHATGDIHLGRTTRRGPFGTSIGSESLGAALRAAAADRDVRAVVLRVDSPGGSYIASDAIRREVQRVRDSGRPVVVSMGPVAASGGYFVSMPADVIVALPGTLTGSIGVFGGKAVVRDLLDRIGIAKDAVAEGRNAEMFSTYRRFSDEEWQRLESWLDRVYDDFTAKVAADRNLAPSEVETIARGRVWTGADAAARGLVDELGGLDRAVEIACRRAGLARSAVDVRTVPRFGLLERFRPAESSEDLPAAAASARAGGAGGGLAASGRAPLAWVAEALGVPSRGVLTAPVLWTLR